MGLFSKLLQRFKRPTTKQLVLGGAYVLLLAGSIGLGLATRQVGSAGVIRDNDPVNSIDGCNRNGGIGAADAAELIKDIKDPNCNYRDLANIYAHFGLTADRYDKFIAEAKNGEIRRNGDVVVDGQIVMNNVWTMGRTTMGKSQREPITIAGKTYYHSPPSVSFASGRQSLPAMVLFDDNGEVITAVIGACGNNIGGGNTIRNRVTCDKLVTSQDEQNPNKYRFSTQATFTGNAKISRVVYTFSDTGEQITKANLADVVEHTFKKDGEVTVTVYAKVPGGKEIRSVAVIHCKKQIKHVAPMFVCTALVSSVLNQDQKQYRFTIRTATDSRTTVKNADFILDDSTTTTGVDSKDSRGDIYRDFTFSDEKSHTIKVVVYFQTLEGVKSDSGHCKATVTPKKQPKCEVPGYEHLPPNDARCSYCKPGIPQGDARCKPEECKPGVPVGDAKCVDEQCTPAMKSANCEELPNTGPGHLAALFFGTSAFGAIGHRLYRNRRASRA